MMESLQKLISQKFTLEVLQEVLERKTGISNPVIKNITIGSEIEKGESYLSVVTRFTVEIYGNNRGDGDRNQFVHMIAKGFPANLARRATFRSEGFFKNEITFYDKVWPVLDHFQKSKNLKNPLTIVPQCLASFTDGVHDYLVLEDLSYEGYSAMKRNTGLDFEESAELVRQFGRFHALSLALKDQQPEKFWEIGNELDEMYYHIKYKDWYMPIINKMFWVLRDAIEKDLTKDYLNKFDDLVKRDFFGEICESMKDRDILCGIAHGDCWPPNLMVKYDKDGRFDTKFIDYQLARCGSVVTDLSFFLCVCLEPSVRDQLWNDFIRIYVESVSEFLKELGSNESLVTVDMVNDGVKKFGLFTLAMCTEALVMAAVEQEDVVDIDEIKEVKPIDQVYIVKLMTNQEKRKKVSGFFKHLVDRQYI